MSALAGAAGVAHVMAVVRGALVPCWAPFASRAAQAYVAGPGLADALDRCLRLRARGVASTIGFWNGGESPRQVADAYQVALSAIAAERLDCYLSIKAPAIACSSALAGEVFAQSRLTGVALHFDSVWPEAASRTLDLIARSLPHAPGVSLSLPARWRRSARDARAAVEMGLGVRLVKGEHPDSEAPDTDPRVGFLRLAGGLAGRARRVAVATHDRRLANTALAALTSADTPCEVESLLGLPPRPPMRAAARAGVGVRCYVPYGHARLPYRLSDASRRPAVLWWVARDLVRGRAPRAVRPGIEEN